MRVVSAAELDGLLSMRDVIALMRDAFVAHGSGRTVLPDRTLLSAPGGRGSVLVMPASLTDRGEIGVKVVSVFPDNPTRSGAPAISAQILALDPETGAVACVIDGTWVTAVRTAAVTALATDLLARPDAERLVVYGAGVQARTHVDAMCAVRPVRMVEVCGRSRTRTDRLVETLRASHPDLDVRVASSPDAAAAWADLVVTATTSTVPVFDGACLREGVHVNAVGSFLPHVRELDTPTVTRARVYVDDRDHAWREAGDLRIPHEEGVFTEQDIVGDLGALVCGRCAGRGDARQITLFKSVGLAIEDVIVAARVRELLTAAD